MLKRRLFWVMLLVVGVVVGLVVVFHREREPEYGGKRLSEWVEECGKYATRTGLADHWPSPAADEAMGHIGTNALPYLLTWVMYQTPERKTDLIREVNPALRRLNPSWQLSDQKNLRHACGAMLALVSPGPVRDAAIPELIRVIDEPKRGNDRGRAAWVLVQMGFAGVPPLLTVIRNKQLKPEFPASMFDWRGTNARPALQEALNDVDSNVRSFASNAILRIDPQALGNAGNR